MRARLLLRMIQLWGDLVVERLSRLGVLWVLWMVDLQLFCMVVIGLKCLVSGNRSKLLSEKEKSFEYGKSCAEMRRISDCRGDKAE